MLPAGTLPAEFEVFHILPAITMAWETAHFGLKIRCPALIFVLT